MILKNLMTKILIFEVKLKKIWKKNILKLFEEYVKLFGWLNISLVKDNLY